MKRAFWIGAAVAVVVALGVGLQVGRSRAAGAPSQAPLTYGGVVSGQDGKPLAGAVEVAVAFYDAPVGGMAKCAAAPVQAEAGSGRFAVVLPSACVDAVHDKADLWAEAAVGPNKVVLPRAKVGAVPYALEADSAKVAGTAMAASSAVGALQQEIAALKAKVDAGAGGGAGGGGFAVYDGAGVLLGKLITAFREGNDFRLHVWTSTGYNVALHHNGKPVHLALYFTQNNCTGDAYLDGYIGMAGKGYMQAKVLTYSAVQNSWLVALSVDGVSNSIGGMGNAPPPKTSVENSNGLCSNNPSGGVSIVGFAKTTKVTPAEAGLPAQIVPGLYIKPL